jgi:hypothetical protein
MYRWCWTIDLTIFWFGAKKSNFRCYSRVWRTSTIHFLFYSMSMLLLKFRATSTTKVGVLVPNVAAPLPPLHVPICAPTHPPHTKVCLFVRENWNHAVIILLNWRYDILTHVSTTVVPSTYQWHIDDIFCIILLEWRYDILTHMSMMVVPPTCQWHIDDIFRIILLEWRHDILTHMSMTVVPPTCLWLVDVIFRIILLNWRYVIRINMSMAVLPPTC